MKTNELTAYIKDELAKIGAVPLRINTGGIYDPKSGGYRKPNHEVGIPDILACKNGRFLGVEVKAGKDKIRLEQFAMIRKLQAAGARVLIAKTPEDIDRWIEEDFPPCRPQDYLSVNQKKTKPKTDLPF